MAIFNLENDARIAFATLKAGGIAIVPNDVGYSILGGSPAALRRIFETKGRAASKLNAMVGNADIQRELHICGQRGRDIVAAITEDYDLPLGCIAPCRIDHPLLRTLTPDALAASTRNDTLVILMNAGKFHAAITRLSFEENSAADRLVRQSQLERNQIHGRSHRARNQGDRRRHHRSRLAEIPCLRRIIDAPQRRDAGRRSHRLLL